MFDGVQHITVFIKSQFSNLSDSLQSPMQILQSRSARSDLPMSNAARQQLGLQSERLRNVSKNENLPSHDLHIGQDVMYQDDSKQAVVSSHYYQLIVCSQDVTILPKGKVSPTGRHKLI